jgi:uncharacterized delta-60 repeat protein
MALPFKQFNGVAPSALLSTAVWRVLLPLLTATLMGGCGGGSSGGAAGTPASGVSAVSGGATAMTFDGLERVNATGYSQDSSGVLNMRVWRYSGSGTLDPSLTIIHPGAAGAGVGQTVGLGIAVDAATGKIVVCGYSIGQDNRWGMTVWRYDANGLLDTTGFNQGSGFVRDIDREGGGVSCAIDSQGRIVVAGFATLGGGWDMALWRYTSAGEPDLSFNNGDAFLTHHGAAGGNGEDIGIGLTIDASDRILVTGYSTAGNGDQDLAVWRFLDDGTLDLTITHNNAGGAGNNDDVGWAIAVDTSNPGNHRIVVTGWSPSPAGSDDMAIWRFNDDGLFDAGFNGVGYLTHNGAAGGSGIDEGRAIVVDGSGGMLVGGHSTNATGNLEFVVWRFLPDGSPDPSLNGTGLAVLSQSSAAINEGGRDLGIDSLGRLWAVGFRGNALASTEVALWSLSP